MKLPKIPIRWIARNWRTITPAKVLNWVSAYVRMNRAGSPSAIPTAQEIAESPQTAQYAWRIAQVFEKSPACISKGACVVCGCDTPEKFWETSACEGGCYPEWMSDDKFKTLHQSNTDDKV